MKRVLLSVILLTGFSGEIASSRARNLSTFPPPTTQEISFKSLGKAAPPFSEPSLPVIYLASNRVDVSLFISRLTEEHQQKIEEYDLSHHRILAVFAGTKGSSGFEIEVKRIVRTKRGLRVIVRQTVPKPDEYGLEVLTSPYHLVAIRSSDLFISTDLNWFLEDERGRFLAAGVFNRK